MNANMNNHVLFIQGGGYGGYEADRKLFISLKTALGRAYDVKYPEIKPDESKPDFGWIEQIHKMISQVESQVIIVAHSFGASMILKYLSENPVSKNIHGVFLLAPPFWSGDEDWKKGLKLREDFAGRLPQVPMFFYRCEDDEEIPLSHLKSYQQKLPRASIREFKSGGHQFNNDMNFVAGDIKSLRHSFNN
jgi:predicted alpha/beta hydrolase family esterase